MRYTITWRCTACGHSRLELRSVPKYNPPRQPDWRALERRARCTQCRAKGTAQITVQGG